VLIVIFSQFECSGVTYGGRAAPPVKLSIKTGPPLVDILIFNILQFVVFCGVFVIFICYGHPEIHYQ